ncbi:unnamed protein product [Miscanthus lutarioriparius]|uniref:PDZ domain-containing protein n=1 Tax=Miscanthus lutarioriparius TaxID=422564 RepID=A0A811QN32_9POAL|nr:unnamed protein product [Miscanthus lutarioriparius]
MLLRCGRRAALLLAAAAAISRGRGPDTAVYASVSPPQALRQALPAAAAEELRSGTRLFSPWLLPSPYQGFPILNTFASASVSPDDHRDQGSDGSSGDSRCCPGCLGRNSIAKAASAVGPAVVNISSMHDMHGWVQEQSIGSGTIIDPDGTIFTCAHVVADFQSTKAIVRRKVSVTLQDGREFEGVVLNADRLSDIAVVKIKSMTPFTGCQAWIVISTSASCVDRKSSDLGLGGLRREYLQTDCAINKGKTVGFVLLTCEISVQGNSGGPLVNLDGEIIGVNVMKVWNADGLSFAVPIDSVIKIVENFKKNGRVVRPWLGLKMLDLNPMIIAQLKEKSSTFPDVTPASPAEQAGFRPGDVVVEFGGKPVESIKEIIDIMGDKVGVPFKVLVKRANNVTVTLTVIPEEADASR